MAFVTSGTNLAATCIFTDSKETRSSIPMRIEGCKWIGSGSMEQMQRVLQSHFAVDSVRPA
jgi:hypothetical protein